MVKRILFIVEIIKSFSNPISTSCLTMCSTEYINCIASKCFTVKGTQWSSPILDQENTQILKLKYIELFFQNKILYLKTTFLKRNIEVD